MAQISYSTGVSRLSRYGWSVLGPLIKRYKITTIRNYMISVKHTKVSADAFAATINIKEGVEQVDEKPAGGGLWYVTWCEVSEVWEEA